MRVRPSTRRRYRKRGANGRPSPSILAAGLSVSSDTCAAADVPFRVPAPRIPVSIVPGAVESSIWSLVCSAAVTTSVGCCHLMLRQSEMLKRAHVLAATRPCRRVPLVGAVHAHDHPSAVPQGSTHACGTYPPCTHLIQARRAPALHLAPSLAACFHLSPTAGLAPFNSPLSLCLTLCSLFSLSVDLLCASQIPHAHPLKSPFSHRHLHRR